MSTNVPTRPRLTTTEREKFESAVEDHEKGQVETDKFYVPANAKRGDDDQVRRIKSVLKEDAAKDSYSEHESVGMEKELKAIKEELQGLMVPQSGMMQRPNKGGVQNYDFRKAVNLLTKNELSNPRFAQLVERYKFLCYALGRQEEANVESIRPE